MTFTTTRKIIRIGTSDGVTIPAADMKRAGMETGDDIKVTFEKVEPSESSTMKNYDDFVEQYGSALKNLAGR